MADRVSPRLPHPGLAPALFCFQVVVALDSVREMLQAQMNSATGGGIPTVFLPGMGNHALVSSRYVREIASAGGDVSSVVPDSVIKALGERGGA